MMGHTMAGQSACLSRKYSAEGQGFFIQLGLRPVTRFSSTCSSSMRSCTSWRFTLSSCHELFVDRSLDQGGLAATMRS